MNKACSRCGKIHPYNYKCNKGRIFQGGEERDLRRQYAWTQKSLDIRERSNYLCAVCRDRGIFTYDNVQVHHIEKLKDNKELFLDDSNLVCLCEEHHKQADRGKINKNYLKSLVAGRDK